MLNLALACILQYKHFDGMGSVKNCFGVAVQDVRTRFFALAV